jgi:hypothetical protein
MDSGFHLDIPQVPDDEVQAQLTAQDLARGFKMPTNAAHFMVLTQAREDGRLQDLLSEPGWEIYKP